MRWRWRRGPTPLEHLVAELRETNQLLRTWLLREGIRVAPLRPSASEPIRPRTAADVTVLTRSALLEEQRKQQAKAQGILLDPPSPPSAA